MLCSAHHGPPQPAGVQLVPARPGAPAPCPGAARAQVSRFGQRRRDRRLCRGGACGSGAGVGIGADPGPGPAWHCGALTARSPGQLLCEQVALCRAVRRSWRGGAAWSCNQRRPVHQCLAQHPQELHALSTALHHMAAACGGFGQEGSKERSRVSPAPDLALGANSPVTSSSRALCQPCLLAWVAS